MDEIASDAFDVGVKNIYLPNHSKDEIGNAPWGASEATIYWADEIVTP